LNENLIPIKKPGSFFAANKKKGDSLIYYIKHLFQKVRHNNFIRLFLDGLSRLGVRITPFYLTLENFSGTEVSQYDTGYEEYQTGFVGPEDMKIISALPIRTFSTENLLAKLEEGKVCFGVKHQGKLAAFTWGDFQECTFDGCPFSLKEDEAYLFDAYTLMEYRGRGLAPFARYQFYKELQKFGKTSLYSVTDCFNKSANRFKEKLGARNLEVGLYVKLFKRWKFRFMLKRYPEIK